MDRKAWLDSVHGVTKSQTRLSTHVYTCCHLQEAWVWVEMRGHLLGPEGGLRHLLLPLHSGRLGLSRERWPEQTADPGPWRRSSLCPPRLMTRVSGLQVGASRPAAPGECWKHKLNLRLWVGLKHLTGLTGAPVWDPPN